MQSCKVKEVQWDGKSISLGLASLVLNMGAAGLKQFAEAGVDFHVLPCMREIAETCPASNEYRREISICRQEQRKQAKWLYKVIEFGTAADFVVDELLKMRAGENVVALMSAILPIMPDNSCDTLTLKLFEAVEPLSSKLLALGSFDRFGTPSHLLYEEQKEKAKSSNTTD